MLPAFTRPSPLFPRRTNRDEEVVLRLASKEGVFHESARRQDACDIAVDESLFGAGFFQLVADGDLVASFKQLGDVAFNGMMGDTAHRDAIALADLPRGQDQLQHLRADARILTEHFVKIAEAEEQQDIGILGFDALILLEHRRQFVAVPVRHTPNTLSTLKGFEHISSVQNFANYITLRAFVLSEKEAASECVNVFNP
jgi:hypothetical protein